MEWKRLSVGAVAAVAMRRLHLEVTDVPNKLSSALLLQSLFYSPSYQYAVQLRLPAWPHAPQWLAMNDALFQSGTLK